MLFDNLFGDSPPQANALENLSAAVVEVVEAVEDVQVLLSRIQNMKCCDPPFAARSFNSITLQKLHQPRRFLGMFTAKHAKAAKI